ncbi:MAG: hypothetical protein HRU76_08410 [Phycisphaeraceae bacterium]|nr:hypothetical protein [Phycisphaerales bacterium]QOJ17603.1 MAG: hypothetical protein HRU76_08410 [Phycisphaeraceae bacterium]
MTSDQLRKALHELDGQRDLRVIFDHAQACLIRGALLIPEEADAMVKVTDGSRVFLLDAHRVAWLIIGKNLAGEVVK